MTLESQTRHGRLVVTSRWGKGRLSQLWSLAWRWRSEVFLNNVHNTVSMTYPYYLAWNSLQMNLVNLQYKLWRHLIHCNLLHYSLDIIFSMKHHFFIILKIILVNLNSFLWGESKYLFICVAHLRSGNMPNSFRLKGSPLNSWPSN